jgi:peptidoglycan/LPS O-acetylase OafA/YrhL
LARRARRPRDRVGAAARVNGAGMPEAPARIHNLDSLRAVAVLLVVVFHYRLLAVGWVGVWIFFVISGFLISRILLDYKTRFELADYLGVFYARRALRIFPIYYLYVGLWSVVALVAFVPKDFAFLPLVTYTFNFVKWSPSYDGSRIFSHLWSLAVEEQFYLVYPLAVFALGRRHLVQVLIAVVVLSPALRYAVGQVAFGFDPDPDYAGRVVFVASFLHADAFAIGGLIALFEPAIRRMSPARFAGGLAAGLILCAGALAANAVAWGSGPSVSTIDPYFFGPTAFGLPVDPFRQLQHVWVYSLIDLAAGLAICVILRALQRPLPIARPLNAIGKISYGVYLYHFALISVADRAFAGVPKQSLAGLGLFALYLSAVLALSALSHLVIEMPFNACKPLSLRRAPIVRVGLAE